MIELADVAVVVNVVVHSRLRQKELGETQNKRECQHVVKKKVAHVLDGQAKLCFLFFFFKFNVF